MLCAASAAAHAQRAFELRGRVVDSISGQPLQDAVVRLPVLGVYTLTDARGLFRFAGVQAVSYIVEVVQLGYGEQSFRVVARPDSFTVLRVAPQPVRLDTLVADSRIMHRTAQRRAQQLGLNADMSRRAVFWDAYDRVRIAASGIDDPIEFLDHRRGANLSLRACPGWRRDDSTAPICLRVPFQVGRITASRGLLAPRVYLDDRRIAIHELRGYTMDDIGRVEAYGMRGEDQIRVYTNGYLRMVSLGVVRPDLTPRPLFDVYRGFPAEDSIFWFPPDTMTTQRR